MCLPLSRKKENARSSAGTANKLVTLKRRLYDAVFNIRVNLTTNIVKKAISEKRQKTGNFEKMKSTTIRLVCTKES